MNAIAGAEPALGAWDRFWFLPSPLRPLRAIRVGMAVLALFYFLSHAAEIVLWFGPAGLLPVDVVGRLMGGGENAVWRFSPLYWVESPWMLRGFLAVAALASLACVWGGAGRTTVALVLAAVLSLVHRGPLIAGLPEIPLCFGLLYLIIQPGPAIRRRGEALLTESHWSATVALRLIQCHLTAILAATVASQLAGTPWWEGEAVLYLVMPEAGASSALAWLGQYPLIAAGLTHLLVAAPVVGIIMAWTEGSERRGATVLWAYLALLAVVSGQFLYAAGLAVLVLAFWPPRDEG